MNYEFRALGIRADKFQPPAMSAHQLGRDGKPKANAAFARAAAEGVVLGAYRFGKYFTADRGPKAPVVRHVGSLIGIGAASQRERDALGDYPKLFFAGRLARSARDADGRDCLANRVYRIEPGPIAVGVLALGSGWGDFEADGWGGRRPAVDGAQVQVGLKGSF